MRSLIVPLVLLCAGCTSTPPAVTNLTCNADESLCGTSCAKTKVDDQNCGSCGRSCESGTACANSACFPTSCNGVACDPASVCFENSCTDKACVGIVCPTGLTCSQGACVCASGRLTCDGKCIDPLTEETNCGGCGAMCAADSTCVQGGCLPNDCPNEDCDELSVCYQNRCVERACVGVSCTNGQVCKGGTCQCETSATVCGSDCVDPRTNNANCGTCGHACGSTDRCAAGACLPQDCPNQMCDPLSVCYQGTCVEAACVGVVCTGGQRCTAGVCTCAANQTLCGGTCVDLQTAAGDCGRCGNACPSSQACVDGACVTNACSGGQTPCGGSCVDTRIDPQHCGACGAACGAGRNCVGSQCTCPGGTTFCGNSCVNIATDATNCGACGRSCGAGTCSGGFCQCPSGQATCGMTCVTLATDPMNCGMCGRTCPTGQTCNSGTCACPPGQTLCSGQCIPTAADNLNCGSCGNVCQSGRSCANSACVLPFTCQTNYNMPPADCADFPVTLANCGEPTLAGTAGPFAGNIPSATNRFILPTPASVSELIRTTTTMSGGTNGSNFRIGFINDAGVELTSATGTAGAINPTVKVMERRGNLLGCAHPASFQVVDTFGALTYSVNEERFSTNGRMNVGSLLAASPAALRTNTAGRTCDQVCGNLTRSCGDTSQYYAVVIPAGKAAIFNYAIYSETGSIYYLKATETTGNTICDLVGNQLVDSGMWKFYAARLVNNTAQTQTVVLQAQNSFGGGNAEFFHLSVAVEP